MRRPILTIGTLAAMSAGLAIAIAYWSASEDRDVGVFERYERELVSAESAPARRDEQFERDAQMLANVLHEVDEIEEEMRRMNEEYLVSENANEGLYTVEQEEHIADAYGRYLVLRRALFHIAFRHKGYAEIEDQRQQDIAFLLAYGAGISLYRNAVIFVLLFKDQPNARRKLNEANPLVGTPEGMFEEMYKNITARENVQLALEGVEEFAERRARLQALPLVEAGPLAGLLRRLETYEGQLAAAYERLSEGRADVLWTSMKAEVERPAYETQSMLSMMISHIRVPLHGKGLTPQTVQRDIRPKLLPGDILLTRRDGYLSNTFLPGNWGHAALYLGSPEEIRALGEDPRIEKLLAEYEAGRDDDGFPFAAIEAIGEGVRFSSAEFAMNANSLAVLRPRVTDEQKRTAILRAMELRGTPYDFSFDVGSQDKIICTELVYRAYAPHLDVPFEEVMGRKTLKPDGMLRELSPMAPEPRTDFVLWGKAADGRLEPRPVGELLATVR